MPTDTERREVARRLRGNAEQDMGWLIPWAVFNDAEQHAGEAVVRRLADLIEPTRNCSEPTRTCGECDRDALLALADEMDERSRWVCVGDAVHAKACARRIREALGVPDKRTTDATAC